MEYVVPFDADKHFGYEECESCFSQPCKKLQILGPYGSGRYVFVHHDQYSMSNCVFAAESFEEVEQYLSVAGFYTVKDLFEDVMWWMGLYQHEQLHYNQDHYLDNWADNHGRIEMLRDLWRDRVIVAIGVPRDYEKNQKVKQWLLCTFEREERMPGEVLKQDDLSGPALTDSLAEQQQQPLSLTNPRWEHADEGKKKDSKDEVMPDDTIILKADITGAPNNTVANFTIYNSSVTPEKRIRSIKGKTTGELASVQWVVDSDLFNQDIKLVFEVEIKNKISAKKEIPVFKEFEYSF